MSQIDLDILATKTGCLVFPEQSQQLRARRFAAHDQPPVSERGEVHSQVKKLGDHWLMAAWEGTGDRKIGR